ncbi:MAG: sigma-70 family RNA polymerase sigma factor [Gemmatimonadota bacterium]
MTDTRNRIPDGLALAAQGGNADALTDLVEAAYPIVRRWTLVWTGDPTEADDVTQEVLIRMVRRIDTFSGDSAFESWLYSTTRNALRDRLRAEGRARRFREESWHWDDLAPASTPRPDAGVEQSELRAMLKVFIEELPDRQRVVFDLVELQGRTAADAGELLGIEPVSVRAHLFKARRTLRARLLADRPEWADGVR